MAKVCLEGTLSAERLNTPCMKKQKTFFFSFFFFWPNESFWSHAGYIFCPDAQTPNYFVEKSKWFEGSLDTINFFFVLSKHFYKQRIPYSIFNVV